MWEKPAPSPDERARIINQLEQIWVDPNQPAGRRRKARRAWEQLTSHTARSYGDPANFVSPGGRRRQKQKV